jgi:hypothetical protein
MIDNTTESLNGFLARHENVEEPTLLREGDVVGEWRVAGFLARGGNAEVYRVERISAVERDARPYHAEDAVGSCVSRDRDGRAGAPPPAEK